MLDDVIVHVLAVFLDDPAVDVRVEHALHRIGPAIVEDDDVAFAEVEGLQPLELLRDIHSLGADVLNGIFDAALLVDPLLKVACDRVLVRNLGAIDGRAADEKDVAVGCRGIRGPAHAVFVIVPAPVIVGGIDHPPLGKDDPGPMREFLVDEGLREERRVPIGRRPCCSDNPSGSAEHRGRPAGSRLRCRAPAPRRPRAMPRSASARQA